MDHRLLVIDLSRFLTSWASSLLDTWRYGRHRYNRLHHLRNTRQLGRLSLDSMASPPNWRTPRNEWDLILWSKHKKTNPRSSKNTPLHVGSFPFNLIQWSNSKHFWSSQNYLCSQHQSFCETQKLLSENRFQKHQTIFAEQRKWEKKRKLKAILILNSKYLLSTEQYFTVPDSRAELLFWTPVIEKARAQPNEMDLLPHFQKGYSPAKI